jgi:hypothetical protein
MAWNPKIFEEAFSAGGASQCELMACGHPKACWKECEDCKGSGIVGHRGGKPVPYETCGGHEDSRGDGGYCIVCEEVGMLKEALQEIAALIKKMSSDYSGTTQNHAGIEKYLPKPAEPLCKACGRPQGDSRYHHDAPRTNWGAALHWFEKPDEPKV